MLTESISAVGRCQLTPLNNEDAGVVNQVMETCSTDVISSGSSVAVYPKMLVCNQIIFSKQIKWVKKRNSFTVVYSNPQVPHQLYYGRVQKFLRCPADSTDSLYIAVIEPLRVESCKLLERLNYPPELQLLAQLLSIDFVCDRDSANYSHSSGTYFHEVF